MQVNRHPKLAGDIREIAIHYGDISDQVLSSSWSSSWSLPPAKLLSGVARM